MKILAIVMLWVFAAMATQSHQYGWAVLFGGYALSAVILFTEEL